ncbi:Piso0_004588 [Millerozyma farinosa CBS 7064]|uniref:Piso0_004588 protein n=1 Tax=Pichia sorbitophila (strain ATCC MYA-4447 / BCRC 22081 / CBS 7064 / NBRC 10061 / NRRL Y-12695) TaxID=559304 RepID=G8Y976_PICSO|nr:Piso0_004588 [Millerozyma farinosa CBS 7064]CCE85021.1 Piso0_004588 [Millerozyma farinosa CBS 7064]
MVFIKATQRNRFTSSIFSSTFAICVSLVAANSLIPCPVDSMHSNDSCIDERLTKKEREQKRAL